MLFVLSFSIFLACQVITFLSLTISFSLSPLIYIVWYIDMYYIIFWHSIVVAFVLIPLLPNKEIRLLLWFRLFHPCIYAFYCIHRRSTLIDKITQSPNTMQLFTIFSPFIHDCSVFYHSSSSNKLCTSFIARYIHMPFVSHLFLWVSLATTIIEYGIEFSVWIIYFTFHASANAFDWEKKASERANELVSIASESRTY